MNTIIWICAAIAVAIFAVMLHSVATFGSVRERTGRYRRRAAIEVVWALIPILIVIAAAVPSMRTAGQDAVAAIAGAPAFSDGR